MNAVVNGLEIYYDTYGQEGRPIVLLHGNGEDCTLFENAAKELCLRGFKVYAPDTRSHGKSQAGELSYELMAKDLEAFIETVVGGPADVFGFSDGGITALMLALVRPELIIRLGAGGVNLNPAGIKKRYLMLFKIAYILTRNPKLELMLTQPDILPERLGNLAMPVLLLAGSRDMIKQEHTDMIAQHIPKAQLKIITGETHSSYIQNPQKLLSCLEPFYTA